MDAVVGVIGASGGIGASTFTAALACALDDAVIVDMHLTGGGIDVLLGIDQEPGARWSDVHVDGGHLDPGALRNALPQWQRCGVLAADTVDVAADTVSELLEAAAAGGPVVVDLPRAGGLATSSALARCCLVVVLARADVVGVAAAHATLAGLPDVPTGLVLRRGEVGDAEAASILGAPVLGCLPPAPGLRGAGCPPRAMRTVARGIVEAVAAAGFGA